MATSAALEPNSVAAAVETAKLTFASFEKLQHLGEGSVGSVSKVKHRETGKVYALKAMDKQRILAHDLGAQILAEVQTQLTVRHSNLLRCMDWFEDEGYVCLVLEYASGGDLYRVLKSRGALSGPDAAHIFAQVAEGVQYLHGRGIIHRDLKPENILLNEDLHVKIADFGWCAQADGRTTFCGTPCMLAPEMIAGQQYDKNVDVWASGVLLFEMLAGFSPFDRGGGLMETCNNIVRRGLSDELLHGLPEAAHSLLRGLLHKDASKRISLLAAVRHPWVLDQLELRRVALSSVVGEELMPPTAKLLVEKLPQRKQATPVQGEGRSGAVAALVSPTSDLLVEQLPNHGCAPATSSTSLPKAAGGYAPKLQTHHEMDTGVRVSAVSEVSNVEGGASGPAQFFIGTRANLQETDEDFLGVCSSKELSNADVAHLDSSAAEIGVAFRHSGDVHEPPASNRGYLMSLRPSEVFFADIPADPGQKFEPVADAAGAAAAGRSSAASVAPPQTELKIPQSSLEILGRAAPAKPGGTAAPPAPHGTQLLTYERLILNANGGGFPGGVSGPIGSVPASDARVPRPIGSVPASDARVPEVVRAGVHLDGPKPKAPARHTPHQQQGPADQLPPWADLHGIDPFAHGADADNARRYSNDRASAQENWLQGALNWVGLGDLAGQAPGAELSPQQRELMVQLEGLGFTMQQALEAVKRTSSVEAAVEWILQHGGTAAAA